MPKGVQWSPERFWRTVKVMPSTCAEWQGTLGERGYGTVPTRGILGGVPRTVGAHRVAWILTHGPIPEGLSVLHRCDNPRCVNVEHLYLGAHQQNMTDVAERMRTSSLTLAWRQVEEIRALWATGEWTQSQLADKFGTTQPNISKIVRGKVRTTAATVDVVPRRREPVHLTGAHTLAIRNDLIAGRTHAEVAAEYGVIRETVTAIARGKRGGFPALPKAEHLSPAQRDEIRARLAQGALQRILAQEYGVSRSLIQVIKYGG